MENELTSIKIKKSTVKRLNLWKYELDCSSIDEVIDRILKIVPASEINNIKIK